VERQQHVCFVSWTASVPTEQAIVHQGAHRYSSANAAPRICLVCVNIMLSCECLDFVHSWRKFGVNKRSFTVLDPTSTKRIVEEGGGVKSSFRSGLRYAYEKKENKHKQHVSTGNSSCSGEDGERESRLGMK